MHSYAEASLVRQPRITVVLPETQVRCILSINDMNAEAVNEYYELDFEIGNTNIFLFKNYDILKGLFYLGKCI